MVIRLLWTVCTGAPWQDPPDAANPLLAIIQAAADKTSMSRTADTITLEQMKGAVGSLVFLWSDIERALRAAIQTELFAGNRKSVHLISQALHVWSERVLLAGAGRSLQSELCQRLTILLKEALVVRNLVCHGLIGYSADLPDRSQVAHLRVELGADSRVLTWDELQAMFQWLSQSGWLISDLTRAAMEKDAGASEDNLRAWKRFSDPL